MTVKLIHELRLKPSDLLRWSRMAFTKKDAQKIATHARASGIKGVRIKRTKLKYGPRYGVTGMATFSQVAKFAAEEARREMAADMASRKRKAEATP